MTAPEYVPCADRTKARIIQRLTEHTEELAGSPDSSMLRTADGLLFVVSPEATRSALERKACLILMDMFSRAPAKELRSIWGDCKKEGFVNTPENKFPIGDRLRGILDVELPGA